MPGHGTRYSTAAINRARASVKGSNSAAAAPPKRSRGGAVYSRTSADATASAPAVSMTISSPRQEISPTVEFVSRSAPQSPTSAVETLCDGCVICGSNGSCGYDADVTVLIVGGGPHALAVLSALNERFPKFSGNKAEPGYGSNTGTAASDYGRSHIRHGTLEICGTGKEVPGPDSRLDCPPSAVACCV